MWRAHIHACLLPGKSQRKHWKFPKALAKFLMTTPAHALDCTGSLLQLLLQCNPTRPSAATADESAHLRGMKPAWTRLWIWTGWRWPVPACMEVATWEHPGAVIGMSRPSQHVPWLMSGSYCSSSCSGILPHWGKGVIARRGAHTWRKQRAQTWSILMQRVCPKVYKLKKVKMGRGNGSRVTGKGC